MAVWQLPTPNKKGKRPWVYDYTDPSGKRHRKTPKSGLKKDADAIRIKIEREMGDGIHTAASATVTISALCDEFLKTQEVRVKDGRVVRTYYDTCKSVIDIHFIPKMGKLLITTVKMTDVEKLYNDMCMSGRVNPRSAKSYLHILQLIFGFAIRREWTKTNPAKEFRSELRGIPKAKIRVFKAEEIEAIIHAAQGPKRVRCTGRWDRLLLCMVSTAAFCGLRYGEITGLLVENVNMDRRMIHVRHSMTYYQDLKGPKTAAGVRDVPMPLQVFRLFEEWLKRDYVKNDRGLLFTGRAGATITHRNFYQQNWMPLLKRAGIADVVRFHALRHFCASWMVDKGIPITEVARLLGHSHFDMTLQTYAHPIMDVAHRYEILDAGTAKFFPTSKVLTLEVARQEYDISA